MNSILLKLRKLKIVILNWEYWNFNVLYFPIYFYWLWLSFKAKSFFFFSTSNPGLENAGFTMESKKNIYDVIPKKYYPKTVLIEKSFSLNEIEQILAKNDFIFPLVAKPDVGEKGRGVQKVKNINEIFNYHHTSKENYLIQEWCNYPNEVGIFYCRYPNSNKGFITGIVEKKFLTIVGDGKKTLEQLILENDRYLLQYNKLKLKYAAEFLKVLEEDQTLVLVPYGNHSRGALFLDVSHNIDDEIQISFDKICKEIEGFYFGRLDIRYQNWEKLKQGKEFSIIELNGAGSEPTHIYDPKHSIFFAWKEIIRHLNILYEISRQNKQRSSLNYLSLKKAYAIYQSKRKHDKLYSN